MAGKWVGRWWLGMVVMALLLTACGRQESSTGAVAVKADAASPAGFAVQGLGARADDSRPRLSLVFSEPVAASQNFATLIEVRDAKGAVVAGGWNLQNDGRTLQFYGVEAQQQYTVKVKTELLNDQGQALAAAFEQRVETVELPPSVGFASKGSVLPARNTEGLPVVSVNVPEVNVEFFRVRADQVSMVLRSYPLSGRNWGWDLRQVAEFAEQVYANTFTLPSAPNQRGVWHLPIQDVAQLRAPGLYFAVMRRTGAFDDSYEVTHYVVSDLGVHLRNYRGQVEVFTRSLLTGAAQGGVDLRILDRHGRVVLEASSGSEGRVTLDYKPQSDHLLVASRSNDLTLMPLSQPALDLSEFDTSGATADQVSAFIWSGRDLYRPAETLRFHALLRDFDGKSITAPKLYATLRQPDGRVHAQAELEPGELGYYSYARVIGADAPTGKWAFEVATDRAAGARQHRFEFRVEEFLPERMKLDLASPQERLAPGDALALEVDAAYLYGAPAAGNRFTGKLVLTVPEDLVPGLKGFRFGDRVNPPKAEAVDVVDATLDESGKLATTVPLGLEQVPGPIAATVLGSVYESGGRPVSRTLTRVVWPADAVVGVRPLFDGNTADYGSKAGFEVVRVNPAGERLAGKVQARLLRLDRQYHWTFDSDLGWNARYTELPQEADQRTLELPADAVARLDLAVEWGAYQLELKDEATGLTTRYAFNAGWGWEENKGLDPRPDKVKLALDKSSYRAGDRLTVTVTPPHEGEGLLLVEAGQLLASQSFTARRGSTVTLDVTDAWERHDVYLTALVFRPGSAADKRTPSRAVGLVHVPIDRAARKLEVTLTAPAQMQPDAALTATIEVPALKGQQAFVTVSAVDVGVTNITRFAVPDPFARFFAKRAFAIDALDIYGRIIEAMAGERARLKFGGDAALGAMPAAGRPNARIQIVDLYQGPVQLDGNGQAKVQLQVPDFNGTLRVSTVVYSADHYGSASAETVVRAPVVAEIGMPRVLAAGDRAQLALDLTNFTGRTGPFKASVTTNEFLSIEPASQSLTLADQAKDTLRFRLSGGGGQGVGTLKVKVEGQGVSIERDFEIAVRPAYPQTRTTRYELIEGDSANVDLSVNLGSWAPQSVRSRVSIANRAPLPVNAAASDLLDYPYGCIEQTSSRLTPYLLLDPANSAKLGLTPLDPEVRNKNADYGINRIGSMQLSSGHFSYWPGSDYADPLLTPYVVDVLLDAQDAGFALPPNLLQTSLERIKTDLLNGGEVAWERHNGNTGTHARFAFSAYAGYVLARVNQAPLGTLRNLHDNERSKALGGLPVMQLAVALKLGGDTERAQVAARQALGDLWVRKQDWLGDYGNTVIDQARMLTLALQHGLLEPGQQPRILEVSRSINDQRWRSTQHNIAILRLARALAGNAGKPLEGALVVGDIREAFNTGGMFSRILTVPDLRAGARLQLSSGGPFYLSQDSVGAPTVAPPAESKGLDIDRDYYDLQGKPWKAGTLAEGEMLLVRLTVRANENYVDALVTDLLPAGLEIENLNLLDASQLESLQIEGTSLKDAREQTSLRFEEYRDDRYVAALANTYDVVRLFYLVRAVTPGSYANPSPLVEDMYRPEIRGIGKLVLPKIEVSGR